MNRRAMCVVPLALFLFASSPTDASAQYRRKPTTGEQVGLVTATVVGGAVGMTTGFLGAGGFVEANCSSPGFGCIVPIFGSAALGALALGIGGASASWLGVSSRWERRHDTGNVLIGTGIGVLAGTGAALAIALPNGIGLDDQPGLLALPVLGASVGAIIGYTIKPDFSVAITPRHDGGVSAHLGFTF